MKLIKLAPCPIWTTSVTITPSFITLPYLMIFFSYKKLCSITFVVFFIAGMWLISSVESSKRRSNPHFPSEKIYPSLKEGKDPGLHRRSSASLCLRYHLLLNSYTCPQEPSKIRRKGEFAIYRKNTVSTILISTVHQICNNFLLLCKKVYTIITKKITTVKVKEQISFIPVYMSVYIKHILLNMAIFSLGNKRLICF